MDLVVRNIGYLKLSDVLLLKDFSIYETSKKTHILIKDTHQENLSLYQPEHGRLEYKIVEGKKICRCTKIFDSNKDLIDTINTIGWNNGNQIRTYEAWC